MNCNWLPIEHATNTDKVCAFESKKEAQAGSGKQEKRLMACHRTNTSLLAAVLVLLLGRRWCQSELLRPPDFSFAHLLPRAARVEVSESLGELQGLCDDALLLFAPPDL